ncbi:hypothetical protein KIH39_12650 [Telmatocola sphagniphila]|uniref:Uncharacterized protein n=1 Tax=Telmatocola sphagniphila TaxID=1123043 RepID=A0A8E6EXB8_9BACT|nr:hypothetical protein [Telmatocola sphagniphila]QVL34717.1 hypothetical protein KIH39_12650 [Telmatocola sphagniphila]
MFDRARVWLAAGFCLVTWGVQAQPPNPKAAPPATTPAAPQADPVSKELVARQQELKRQFGEFSKALLTLAQNYEKSERVEDKDKAKTLRKAIDLVEKDAIENKFSNLIRIISKSNDISINEVQQAIGQNEELARSLREILSLLLSDDELARIKEEKERLEKQLAELKGLLRDQKQLRAMNESDRADKKRLSKDQDQVAKKTDELAKKMGAESKPSDAKPKPGDPKPGDPKPGDPKPSQPGQPKDGDPKPGQPSPPKNQPPKSPGADQVQKAVPDQQDATKKLGEEKKEDAAKKQTEAIDKLTKAQEELEKRLKQLREEELKRILAALEARCNKMLTMQIDVYENTKIIQQIVLKNADRKPTKLEFQKAQQQSDKESDIIAEADKVLEILKAEGSAVAFPDVFEEVRRDMISVKERLRKGITDDKTQLIEEDIIAALKEIIAALKKQQQEGSSGSGGGGGSPSDQKLLNELAELKLIRSLQVRVNERTKAYSRKFEGEQADDEVIRKDLHDLAEKQEKIWTMTKNMATGKNK